MVGLLADAAVKLRQVRIGLVGQVVADYAPIAVRVLVGISSQK